MKRNFKKQAGVSLVEAMVSLVVFSVGALGLAALQTAAFSTSGDTKQRSLAVWKAQELADRMRSTKSDADPDGALPAFLAAIDNNADGVGTYNNDNYTCPAVPANRCADYRDAADDLQTGAACTEAQLVAFDIWDVLCEPNTGLSPTLVADEGDSGVVGVQNLEVAMVEDGDDYLLYFEWLARSAEQGQQSIRGADADTLSEEITVSLCGEDVDMDPRMDAYCVRIR